MIKIKDKIEQKAMNTADDLKMAAQTRYLLNLCDERGIDMETAVALALGLSDPTEPEISLGYKLADPAFQIAMWAQISKKKRAQAAENFKDTLTEKERILFETEEIQTKYAGKFQKEMKKSSNRRFVRF